MDRRQTLRHDKSILPRIWLMTDPRFGDGLLRAVRKLPIGSGVIFRHYHLPDGERFRLFRNVRKICRQRGHVILLAGDENNARRWHADGFHGRKRRSPIMVHSAAVHDRHELAKARRMGADMVLISPLFSTASHVGQRPMGIARFITLAQLAGKMKVIALGGMTARKASMLDKASVYGWAAIDAFSKIDEN